MVTRLSAARRTLLGITLTLFVVGIVALALTPGARDLVGAVAAGDPDELRASLTALGPTAPAASVLLNVLQGVIAPIPGFVVPYMNGVVFGTWWGMLLSWIGGIGAAAAAFGVARTFGRRFAERICARSATLDRANRVLTDHGLGAMILARLLPGMPFDAFSYLGGLSRVRFTPFIVGTAIGSAPHAYLYALLGDHLDVPLWVGLAATPLLGLMMLAAHRLAVVAHRRIVGAPAGA